MSVGLLAGCQQAQSETVAPDVVPVTVSVPIERQIDDCEEFTGRTEAVESVEIRSRVTGYLNKVCFAEGAEVKKGDLLFEIDPRPFQAKYERALSQIKVCQADLKLREAELERAKDLLPKKAISQSDYDQIVANHAQALAQVAAAEAGAQEVKLDLDFTKLYSPIDGEISRARVTKGNLVNADQTLLTTIVSVNPMYVYFDADEQTILDIGQAVRDGRIKVPGEHSVPVWMGLANHEGFPCQGIIDFAENRVDSSTGTIRLRGVFDNPVPSVGGRVLLPGLFARVRVQVGEPYQALMVVERALGTDQGQKYVLVVNNKNEVEYRRVKLGRQEGRLRVIREGLQPGEQVIVSGQQRVRPGSHVVPKTVAMDAVGASGEGARPAQAASPASLSSTTSEKP